MRRGKGENVEGENRRRDSETETKGRRETRARKDGIAKIKKKRRTEEEAVRQRWTNGEREKGKRKRQE